MLLKKGILVTPEPGEISPLTPEVSHPGGISPLTPGDLTPDPGGISPMTTEDLTLDPGEDFRESDKFQQHKSL